MGDGEAEAGEVGDVEVGDVEMEDGDVGSTTVVRGGRWRWTLEQR
jgi:hypothetical protein